MGQREEEQHTHPGSPWRGRSEISANTGPPGALEGDHGWGRG